MFYLLSDSKLIDDKQTNNTGLNLHLYHACLQAAYFYRNNQRVFIFTQDQQNAHDIDEMLWTFEPDSFVPHNLIGEGHKSGSPVEISWQAPTNHRPVLINLTNTVPSFANQFTTIIDFVPTDETLKQQARDRFRAYRQWGFEVNNQPAPELQQSIAVINN